MMLVSDCCDLELAHWGDSSWNVCQHDRSRIALGEIRLLGELATRYVREQDKRRTLTITVVALVKEMARLSRMTSFVIPDDWSQADFVELMLEADRLAKPLHDDGGSSA